MSNKVSLAAVTQDVTFADSIATGHSVPAYCGARTYTFSPIYTFLTISGTTLSLATSLVSDVGTYNVNMIVSLTDYSGVASITKLIVITITCEVFTITANTVPVSYSQYRINLDAPLILPFSFTEDP